MDQLLDLCITLTPPPEGSPSESIASITLSCDSLGLSHTSDLLDDPLTPEERDDLRWYLEEYWKWPYEGFAQRGREVEALLPILGKRLYIGVFGSVEADRIVKRWLAQSNGRRQISIISTIPKILSLPWELLHDESSFLALNTDHPVPIVRCLWPSEARMVSPPFELPLRVLLVTARPEKTAFIDPRGVARELLDELDEHLEAGTIEIEFLRPPTLSALRTRLKDTKRPIHVLHFDGHGRFEEEIDGQGMLLFEDNEGRRSVVGAEKLAQVLRRSGVRLVVLTACQSAMGSIQDAFSSVAAQLIRSGVDTVIAMGASVLAANVTLYVETFYREMAAGRPTSTAHEQAQQTLHNNRHRLLHRRQRDEEGQSVELCDWWLPQFYQQRPLLLQPIRQVQSRNQQVLASRSTARLNSNLPAEPHYGFYGRAYDLLQIERWLTRGKLVLISGLSGIGKTTLAREAADWLTRTRMYERACYISFEQGGDASTLLSVLGDFMEVYDSSYAPNESKASLAKLDRVLKEWRTLVIVDNLEGSLSNGGLPLTGQPGTRLWHLLLELVEMGAGVLLISRDTKYTDRRQGKRVAHLALDCLHPEDAYELAWSILDTPEINSVHVPYPELRDLLAQLDYHPLAIQLVLPKLRELPISSLRKELTALLPQFQDDAVAGQNGSLLASLEYSMHHLDEKQQALLYCLAPFEGWAREDDLLAITQMLKDEWDSLGIALEQTGLMTVERIPGIADRFLRFHPVLPPFLRGQPVGSDYTVLQERFARRYSELASYLYLEDQYRSLQVRALFLHELPNLRRALELLLNMGELETASTMTNCVVRFLNSFGMVRERNELRQLLAKALAAAGSHTNETLTSEAWWRESDLAQDERQQGNLRSAKARFMALLTQIEAVLEGAPLSRGSYEHCATLYGLALCLREEMQLAAAEELLQEALSIIDRLLLLQPDHETFIRARTSMLIDLGTVLSDQGKYGPARTMYQEGLKIADQRGDMQTQAMAIEQLGTLALMQRKFTEARSHYNVALRIDQAIGETWMEGIVWHQLGLVAMEQEEWAEAERCYRQSLALRERHGDLVGAAKACNQLALISEETGRREEAEGWYRRALKLDEQVQPGSLSNAMHLSNFATLLLNKAEEDQTSRARLDEARDYAEQALAILEAHDTLSGIWKTLHLLSKIAAMNGRIDETHRYRRRERETYASFVGNRDQIDRVHGQLIADMARAATGNIEVLAKLEVVQSQMEVYDWSIAPALRRILAGERHWHILVEDLSNPEALLVLRILETITQLTEAPGKTPEQTMASLSPAIRVAMEDSEAGSVQQFEALPPEVQREVQTAVRAMQTEQQEKIATGVRSFEPLLQSIAMEATGIFTGRTGLEPLLQSLAREVAGNPTQRDGIEVMLDEFETKGLRLKEAAQRIWAGERDFLSLAKGLDELEMAMVNRVLEIIAESTETQPGTPEQIIASLPPPIRKALEHGDTTAFKQAFAGLSSDEQQRVEEALAFLQVQQANSFEPLLQAIALVAVGDATQRGEIEEILDDLESRKFHLKEPVQQIWAGERDIAFLTNGLEEQASVLVRRVLQIIALSKA